MLSVCMITYNHEKYIAQAIEGVLMQECDFPVQLVIGEDHSTDNTRQICEEYAVKHPHQIVLLPDPGKNLGATQNFIQTFNTCNGDYIAICEGDDYWTDNKKLQTQFSFLENNPSYSFCSHGYNTLDSNNEYVENKNPLSKDDNHSGIEITPINVFDVRLTKNLTLFYRKDILNIDFNKYKQITDTLFLYHLINKGNGYYLDFMGGIYRFHETNSWNNLSVEKKLTSAYLQYKDIAKINSGRKDFIFQKVISFNYFLLNHYLHVNNRDSFNTIKIIQYSLLLVVNESNKRKALVFLRRKVFPVIVLYYKIKLRKVISFNTK